MSTPCSMAGGRSIGSSAGALSPCAAGDCHGWPCGAGLAIHGSATAARGAGYDGGGGGGGTGAGAAHCAKATAGIVSALSARRKWRFITLAYLGTETERLQNHPLTSGANYSPSSGRVSRSAVGDPSFSAIRSTSSSLGASGSSSPGASASSAMSGPVPAIVSLIGSSLGPVLTFSRSSTIWASLREPPDKRAGQHECSPV